jgi:type VI secretion system protein ImpH
MTEYARDRDRHFGDRTLTRFLDVFHHRAFLMFHRAWAQAQPTVAMDRPGADAFAAYVGACFGMGLPATRGRGGLPDRAKLFYAGRLLSATRNAEGLEAIVADYFGVCATVEEFVGDWMELPIEERWQLGIARETGTLGRTAVLGARVWGRSHKFRVVLGPLSASQFEHSLPGSVGLETLLRLVSLYTNDQWEWDLLLVLSADAAVPLRLGSGARLGWTTQLGRSSKTHTLIVDPRRGATRRPPARHVQAEGSRTQRA